MHFHHSFLVAKSIAKLERIHHVILKIILKNRGLFFQTKTSSKPTYAGDVQQRIDSLSGICMWINTSSSTTAPLGAPSTSHFSPALWLLDDLLLNHVYHLIGYSEIFDGAPSDVTFGHSPKPVTILSFKITNHHWTKHFPVWSWNWILDPRLKFHKPTQSYLP